jgi:hypothetical protein
MAIADIEVGEEDHLQPPGNIYVVVDHLSNRSDQLDDQLGHAVSRRRLAAEDEGPRGDGDPGIALDPVIDGDDVQHLEMLPFVLMNPFDQNIEQAGRVHDNAGLLHDQRRQGLFVLSLDLMPRFPEGAVCGKFLQSAQLLGLR